MDEKKKVTITVISTLTLLAMIFIFSGITGNVILNSDHEITLEEGKFTPNKLKIAVSEKVTWKNLGNENCFLLTHDRSLNSEDISSKKSFSYTFESTGDYFYFCRNNPTVEGLVLVR